MQTTKERITAALEHYRSGRRPEAEAICRSVLEHEPEHAGALELLGVLLRHGGKPLAALPFLEKAVGLRPESSGLHFEIALAYRMLGRAPEAAAAYERSLSLDPARADAHNNLGNVLRELGQLDRAVAHFRRALTLRPHDAEAHNNLGNALWNQGRLHDAAASYGEALRLRPAYGEAFNNLGTVLKDLGRPDEAESHLRHALKLKPGIPIIHVNLGAVLADLGRPDEALAEYERALAIDPTFRLAQWNQAILWLLHGDFARGWPAFEWRLAQANRLPRTLEEPRWDGRPLEGRRVLVHTEQGLGDTLQFVRFLPEVKRRGGAVQLVCQAALVPLLAKAPGVERAYPEGGALPPHDVYVPLMSLAGLFGVDGASVPAKPSYLVANPALRARWREKIGPGSELKVGIVWQGSPGHKLDHDRSVALSWFAPLSRIEGVKLFSLQVGQGSEALASAKLPIEDLGGEFDAASLADAAAAVAELDLIVTVDTSIAHLAGALGVPVWVALPAVPDWRWLTEREDTPWYPSMRLFRQPRRGDWYDVFARIAAGLARLGTEPKKAPRATAKKASAKPKAKAAKPRR